MAREFVESALCLLHESDRVTGSESTLFGRITQATVPNDGYFCDSLRCDGLASTGSPGHFAVLGRACRDSEALRLILLSHCVGCCDLNERGGDTSMLEGNVLICRWRGRIWDGRIGCLDGLGFPGLTP